MKIRTCSLSDKIPDHAARLFTKQEGTNKGFCLVNETQFSIPREIPADRAVMTYQPTQPELGGSRLHLPVHK